MQQLEQVFTWQRGLWDAHLPAIDQQGQENVRQHSASNPGMLDDRATTLTGRWPFSSQPQPPTT
jgi:hypothetical protein